MGQDPRDLPEVRLDAAIGGNIHMLTTAEFPAGCDPPPIAMFTPVGVSDTDCCGRAKSAMPGEI